ncbi:MAG: hypothetical protein CME59_10100 [Halioglobus sp.]|nr:hypothetical protein [Halioglobus sp.]|tara:strand:+ start:3114 stop:3986 length:873 start_codon:yes stop_codon:yes gene_type:complete
MKSSLYRALAPLLFTVVALLAGPAQAGTADVTDAEGNTMRFEYRGDLLRVNMDQEGAAGYMLLRDNNLYVVTNSDGNLMVIDANQAWGMFGSMAAGATPDMVANEVVELSATGEKEQIAGITGEVYRLRFRAEDGSERESTLVLTDDPRARDFRDAMHNFATTMSKTVGKDYKAATDDFHGRLAAMNMGVLRYGDDMKVSAINQDSVDPARFELPAAPMDLSNIGALFGASQGGAEGEAEDSSAGGPLSTFLGSLGGSSEEEASAEEEEDAESGSAAKELGKAFGRLFGN